jgi:hypothetical protein
MNYKVGDKVKMRKDLHQDRMYGKVWFRAGMFFPTVTIKTVNDFASHYTIEESDNFVYSDEMFDGLVESSDVIKEEEKAPYGIASGTVSPSGGARAGTKKPRVSIIPMLALLEVAKVMTKGEVKYGTNNWQKGMPHSWHLDAGLRHLLSVSEGDMIDDETGLEHLAHAAADILMCLESRLKNLPTDDLSIRKIKA